MLVLIGVFKLAKGILVVALALNLLRAGPEGLVADATRWATRLHIDPDGRHFGRLVHAVAGLDGRRLQVAGAALFAYGALFLIEGTGLVLRRRWAEYFTVIVTGSFIPLELYEITRRPDGIRVAVCLVNVAIVWYLARGLRRMRPRTVRRT